MGLAESVLEIADELGGYAEEIKEYGEGEYFGEQWGQVGVRLQDIAKTLRLVVKAADVPKSAISSQELQAFTAPIRIPESPQFEWEKKKLRREEDNITGEMMTVLEGGGSANVTFPVPVNAVVGTMTMAEGQIYKRDERGVWKYSEEDTRKRFGRP